MLWTVEQHNVATKRKVAMSLEQTPSCYSKLLVDCEQEDWRVVLLIITGSKWTSYDYADQQLPLFNVMLLYVEYRYFSPNKFLLACLYI